MFEPGSAAWWAAVKQFRPDLYTAFNPWERIITPQAVNQLLRGPGVKRHAFARAVTSPRILWKSEGMGLRCFQKMSGK